MIDTNQCRMVYDDNEEEYEEYYDYELESSPEDLSTSGENHVLAGQS